jgi:ankyrin repeat protein
MDNVRSRAGQLTVVLAATLFFVASAGGVSAQEKRYALVIGNGAYAHITKLTNPAHDAADMATELTALGFTVDLLTDRDLATMEDAVVRLGNRLSTSPSAVGFFYYAGHGVQAAGTNYFIPTEANIPSSSFLQQKALALQSVLDTLQAAGNKLNVVVLDACRDNPFSWSRSGTRGLTTVGVQPPGSIIVYATSAGSVAQDGKGRNGVFTGELLKHMRSPGADISDVFKQTGAGVSAATAGSQIPAVYTQFFGSYALVAAAPPVQTGASPTVSVTKPHGSVVVTTAADGTLFLDGTSMADLPAGASARLDSVDAGSRILEIHYADGHLERRTAAVEAGTEIRVAFAYQLDLFNLARSGTAASISAAIRQGADLTAKDAFGRTALMIAIANNPNPGVITALLQAGAKTNAQDGDGRTPLMIAAISNPGPEVITALVQAGANLKDHTKDGLTPLMLAARNNNPAVISSLIQAGADPGERAKYMTLLMQAANYNPDPEVIAALLRLGADVNARSGPRGLDETPLILAAANNSNPEVINRLLAAGADVSVRDSHAQTAFDYAQRNEKLRGTEAYRKLAAASGQPVAAGTVQGAPSDRALAQDVPQDALRTGDSLPRASIKIDGNFDEWTGIPPAFTSGSGSQDNMKLAIDKVYLAVDEKNVYMKFDIQDDTPSSFFHPNNFDLRHNGNYALNLSNGSREVEAHIAYYGNTSSWKVEMFQRVIGGSWELVAASGTFAMKGSSLEANFPLESIRKALESVGASLGYDVRIYIGYKEKQTDTYLDGDHTETKRFSF